MTGSFATPILIEPRHSLMTSNNEERSSNQQYDMTELKLDDINIETMNDTHEHHITETMQSIRLTPTSTMRYEQFKFENKDFIKMQLLKYPGNYSHNIRYFAEPHLKCCLYLPQLKYVISFIFWCI